MFNQSIKTVSDLKKLSQRQLNYLSDFLFYLQDDRLRKNSYIEKEKNYFKQLFPTINNIYWLIDLIELFKLGLYLPKNIETFEQAEDYLKNNFMNENTISDEYIDVNKADLFMLSWGFIYDILPHDCTIIGVSVDNTLKLIHTPTNIFIFIKEETNDVYSFECAFDEKNKNQVKEGLR